MGTGSPSGGRPGMSSSLLRPGGRYPAGMTLVGSARAGAVATLTLDSPHNRNALSAGLIEELTAGIDAAVQDPAVRVIVLTHTGPVFCSGADLKETAAAFAERRDLPSGVGSD